MLKRLVFLTMALIALGVNLKAQDNDLIKNAQAEVAAAEKAIEKAEAGDPKTVEAAIIKTEAKIQPDKHIETSPQGITPAGEAATPPAQAATP